MARTNWRYTDIDFDFKAHPVSGDLILKHNEEAIKKAVRSLILTNKYDKPFQPDINGGVRELLFENMTPVTAVKLKSNIEFVLQQYEPRVKVLSVNVVQNDDNNNIEVTIQFAMENQPEPVIVTTVLERTR